MLAPPQVMHFPELTSGAGAALVTAEAVGIQQRIAPVSRASGTGV